MNVHSSSTAAAPGRPEGAWSLLLVDLDRCAALDVASWRPAAGHVLAGVAALLRATVPGGVVGRFGGGEFVVLVPGPGPERRAEAVRRAVARLDTLVDGPAGRVRVSGVTASIGVAARRPGSRAALAELLWAADRALYAAKRAGGDAVRVAADGGHDVGIEIP